MSPDYDDSYSSGFYRMEMFGNYELRSMDLLVFMFLCLAFRAFQKKSVHESPFAGGKGVYDSNHLFDRKRKCVTRLFKKDN